MLIAGFADATFAAIGIMGGLLAPVWHEVCGTGAPLVVTAFWQSAVLAAAMMICLRLARGLSAAQRFLVWAAGFVAMMCLPLLPLLIRMASDSVGDAGTNAGARPTGLLPWLQVDECWGGAILLLWASASILRCVDLTVHFFRLRKLWKTATPIQFDRRNVDALNSNRGRRRFEICTTRELESPSVIGFFSPRILIPEWLLERITREELDQILLHEAEHLRRGDDWSNLVQKFCLVLFPLNPALFWVERQLCLEREMACDQAVVNATRAPRAYATCLTSLAERGREHRAEALSLGAWQGRSELAKRIHGILLCKDRLSSVVAYSLLVLIGCGLFAGTVALSKCPQMIAFTLGRDSQSGAHPQSLRLADAGYAQAFNDAVASTRFSEVQALAVMPTGHSGIAAVHSKSTLVAPKRRAAAQESSARVVSSRDYEPVLPNVSVVESPGVVEQQWVVLTSWEQVSPTSNTLAESSLRRNFGTAEATEAQENVQPAPERMGQATITRLIVRILPAGFKFDRPDAGRVNNGWLVLQL